MILSFINQKGGVGKSTLSINAADCLRRQGFRTLLIDADPQGTANDWASRRDELPFPVVPLARRNMAQEILSLAVHYDHVVIDGPPRAEVLSRAVIIASDLVVIPIEASGASDWASQTTIRQVQEARQYKENLISVLLLSRVIPKTVIGRSIREHVADHGIPLLEAAVANRVPFAEALTMGETIYEWSSRSAAAKEFSRVMQEIGAFYEQERPDETAPHEATHG
ncbi:MAG: ParA family protein [Bryobacterales bacterium]|nr:ParA family protein [Bryobacterales bacterium]